MKKTALLIAAVLLAFASGAQAQIILYQDFAGPAHAYVYLGGTYPDPDLLSTAGTTPPTPPAKWSANGNAYTYGNSAALSGNEFNTGGTASLPFVPVAGTIYTLSANIAIPVVLSGGAYAALGFTSSAASPSTLLFPSLGPEPYLQLGSSGGVQTNAAGASNTYTPSPTAGDEYSIVLNTEAPDWTVSFYQGGIQLGTTQTYTSGNNPVINDVAIGADAYDTGTYSNFKLSQAATIPEPSTYMLLVLGGVTLWIVSRRRASLGYR